MTLSPWEALWVKPEPTAAPPVNGHVVDPARVGRWAARAFESELERVRTASNGTRNDNLNTASFSLGQIVAGGALDEAEVRNALHAVAIAVGLEEHETTATIDSGIKSGMETPRTAPESDVPNPYVLDAPDLRPDREAQFWAARPLLTLLHDYARARRVSPWAVLGVALCRVVTAVPPHYVLPPIVGAPASLNLFVGLVGPSGAGKGAAEQVAAEALDVGFIESHKTGSGEGIAHGYMKRERGEVIQHTTAVLFSVPEIDTLTALGNRQGATLLPELRSAWSGEKLGFSYADPSKRLPIPAHQYRLCLVAGIQPQRAQALLEDSDGGTPQRFLWLPAVDADAPDVAPPCPDRAEWELPGYRDTHDFTTPSGRVELRVCDQARSTIDQARLDRLRGVGDALDGHALLTQLKTAAALALAEGRVDVTDDDWSLAAILSEKSAAVRAGVARAVADAKATVNRGRAEAEATRAVRVSERLDEASVKRVSRAIVRVLRKEGEPIARNALRKRMDSRDRPHLDEALEHLEASDLVVAEDIEYQGQIGTNYRLREGV